MDELKHVIGKNIIELRRRTQLTQAELAEKLNYSDKAVSKWECGDAVADILVLKKISKLFGVTIDYLTQEVHDAAPAVADVSLAKKANHRVIASLSVALVFLIATLFFVVPLILGIHMQGLWIAFVYAIPLSCVVLLVFDSIWGNVHHLVVILTVLVWSVLFAVYITFLAHNIYLIFVLGVPAQVIILLSSKFQRHPKLK